MSSSAPSAQSTPSAALDGPDSKRETGTPESSVDVAPGMQMYVVNTPGSYVSDAHAIFMITACNTLIVEAARLWNRKAAPSIRLWDKDTDMKAVRPDAHFFYLIDQPSKEPPILAEHARVRNLWPVYVYPVISNGGFILGSKSQETTTVAAALWQMIVEKFLEPADTYWADLCAGELIAAKVCDPVRSVPVPVTVTLTPPKTPISATSDDTEGGDQANTVFAEARKAVEPPAVETIDVILCDFVLPAWRDSGADEAGRFNYASTLQHPFQIAPGGAVLKIDATSILPQYVFGRKMPMWMRSEKRSQHGVHYVKK